MKTSVDIVEQAAQVADNYLELLEALYEGNESLAAAKSNLVCRCPACKDHRVMTLTWIDSMLEREPSLT